MAVTDLSPSLNLAMLHTMYANKDSGFKAQGILTYPILLSVGTTFTPGCTNFALNAYSFNPTYRFCKDLFDVTAFEQLSVAVSLGEADFESMAPLFEALRDQEEVVPRSEAKNMMRLLGERIKDLKIACEGENG